MRKWFVYFRSFDDRIRLLVNAMSLQDALEIGKLRLDEIAPRPMESGERVYWELDEIIDVEVFNGFIE